MKRITGLILLIVISVSAVSLPAIAEDNATGGDGDVGKKVQGGAWYDPDECMWKVTIYVGKSDTANTDSNLTNDYYKIGTLIVKRDFTTYEPFYYGNACKADYLNGVTFKKVKTSDVIILTDNTVPYPPILNNSGNIDDVKDYFGSSGFLTTALQNIANKRNTTTYGLVKSKKFTIAGTTKSGWQSDYIIPNSKTPTNRVPWVVVYEPIVTLHLNDENTKVAFTATEFVLAALGGMYNWDGGTNGQKVTRLPYAWMPSSVQLEESWFGYPCYPVKAKDTRWTNAEILNGGGWGMRFLPISEKYKDNQDLTISCIKANSDYKAGMTVVTSYRIYNKSAYKDVKPADNNTITFEAYYYKNGKKTVISSQKLKQAVVPAGENNLVWFKWTIPSNLAGTKVYCKAIVNADNTIFESSTTNNSILTAKVIASPDNSQTPDTDYEREAPKDFTKTATPSTKSQVAVWTVWEYEEGAFVEKTYSIKVSAATPSITPDSDIGSVSYKYSTWYMASGYGFTISYKPSLTTGSSYLTPPKSAYTDIQEVKALFPEFSYSLEDGEYRVLEKVGSAWQFIQNDIADQKERLHFTPIWYPNGSYKVATIATEIWTPAGMIECTKTTNAIVISGSAYDDWHITHN